jgi:hypothetical protein
VTAITNVRPGLENFGRLCTKTDVGGPGRGFPRAAQSGVTTVQSLRFSVSALSHSASPHLVRRCVFLQEVAEREERVVWVCPVGAADTDEIDGLREICAPGVLIAKNVVWNVLDAELEHTRASRVAYRREYVLANH